MSMHRMTKVAALFLACSLFVSSAQAAGPNFLWNSGTSNNGQIASSLTLETTELNSLANAAVAVSSVGGSSGLFTNANTGQAIWGQIQFTAGTAGAACAAGANISGWFLTTFDGTTFEPTAAAPARAPDFVISLPATTLNATYMSTLIRVPALKFKVLAQNNCGASGTLAASANILTLGLMAIQY